MWLWTLAYPSLSLNFPLHNTVLYCACSELSHDIHLSNRFHLSLGECHTWNVIFYFNLLCLYPASSLTPWWCSAASLTLPPWYSRWYHILDCVPWDSFEWRTEYSGIFITAYFNAFCTHSCTSWVFIIANIATLQSWMAHLPFCLAFAYCGFFTCAATMDCIASHGGV